MLRIIAIDDEPIALEVIRNLSLEIPFIQIVQVFTDPFKAIELLQREKIDLIFLDIKMPDISGIEFIRSLNNPPMVIFTTAYSEHAVQSFELNAIDYLLKPFSQFRFLKACNKALEQYELRKKGGTSSEPTYVFIKTGLEQIRINFRSILYAESNGNYVQFITDTKKIISRITMSEAESLLPTNYFIRIHRSFIVSVEKITKFERRSLWIDDVEIPIGAAYDEELKKILK